MSKKEKEVPGGRGGGDRARGALEMLQLPLFIMFMLLTDPRRLFCLVVSAWFLWNA